MDRVKMSSSSLQKLRECQLSIALEIVKLCEAHGLHIFLCDGSALGAYRHSGFIPWDDDVDMCMCRADFVKLKKLILENRLDSQKLFWADMFTHKEFSYSFAKVMKKGTLCVEHENVPREMQCISVDIFPLDNVPDSVFFARLHSLFVNAFACALSMKRRKNASNIRYALILKILPDAFVKHAQNVCMRFFNLLNTKKVGNVVHVRGYFAAIYPREIWRCARFIEFERYLLPVPTDINEYLRLTFGDYMKLPALEDRKGHDYLLVDVGDC